MYVKITSGNVSQFPYTIGQLRRDNPLTSFPQVIPMDILASYDVYPVVVNSEPSFNPLSQTLTRNTAPTYDGTKWVISYSVSSKTTEEAAAAVRAERDALLATSDLHALADRITDEWRTYRQALRDLPAQSNFPDVAMPVAPS